MDFLEVIPELTCIGITRQATCIYVYYVQRIGVINESIFKRKPIVQEKEDSSNRMQDYSRMDMTYSTISPPQH